MRVCSLFLVFVADKADKEVQVQSNDISLALQHPESVPQDPAAPQS